jgi:2-amino-4-hydroxy-6-hydroxymethyldihydropteridine diphosphokinase
MKPAAGIHAAIGHAGATAAGAEPADAEDRGVKAWIGLGGNRGDSADLILDALDHIARLPDTAVPRRSSLYRSAPWGVSGQPDFTNAVAEVDTGLAPEDLLQALLDIEIALGRIRKGNRWGPRCIDLDLLSYEHVTLCSRQLSLPHPRMHLRAFVLVPLLELEPDFIIAGIGPAAEQLDKLDAEERDSVTIIGSSRQGTEK